MAMREPFGNIRLRSRLKPFAGRADLTPLVDVLFLLLIFFMLTSSFVQVSGVAVDLPRTSSSARAGLEKFIVTVALDGGGGYAVYFRDRPVDWDDLKEEFIRVSAESAQGTIIIRADRMIPLWVAMEVEALAASSGLSSFIVTLPPETETPAVFE